MKPIESQIITILNEEFKPLVLEVENESDMHQGPPGRESHFKVYIVSEAFNGKKRLERQRLIFAALREPMLKVHALALRAVTPEEHSDSQTQFMSPQCASKK